MHTFYADTVLPGYFLPEAVTESQKTVEGMHENRNKMFFFFLGGGARGWTRTSRVLTVPCIAELHPRP